LDIVLVWFISDEFWQIQIDSSLLESFGFFDGFKGFI